MLNWDIEDIYGVIQRIYPELETGIDGLGAIMIKKDDFIVVIEKQTYEVFSFEKHKVKPKIVDTSLHKWRIHKGGTLIHVTLPYSGFSLLEIRVIKVLGYLLYGEKVE